MGPGVARKRPGIPTAGQVRGVEEVRLRSGLARRLAAQASAISIAPSASTRYAIGPVELGLGPADRYAELAASWACAIGWPAAAASVSTALWATAASWALEIK